MLYHIINIVLCFIAGFITGKRIIVRRPAFWTGVVAVAIIYIASFLLRYIPGYPGNISGQQYSGQVAGGIAVELEDEKTALMKAFQSDKSTQSHTAIVRSPMPGKITRVLVSEGDQVEAGQGVIPQMFSA